MSDDRRQAIIDGLREFADFLEDHPDAEPPGDRDMYVPDFQSAAPNGTTLAKLTDRAQRFGGSWRPSLRDSDRYFYLERMFGPAIRYTIYTLAEAVAIPVETTETVTRTEWRLPDLEEVW